MVNQMTTTFIIVVRLLVLAELPKGMDEQFIPYL